MRVLILLAVITWLASCDCTLIGCSQEVFVLVKMPPSLKGNPSATLRVCMNGVCTTGPVPATGTGGGLHGPVPVLFGGYRAQDDGTGRMVMYLMLTVEPPGPTRDGDIYSVEIEDPTGATMERVSFEKSVTYYEIQPNGPGCGPECAQATIYG